MDIKKIESTGKELRFHHIGLAVREPTKALGVLTALGYTATPSIKDSLQKVNLIFCSHATQPAVEIIFPADAGGPLDTILKNHPASFYHICFATENVKTALECLKRNGVHYIPIEQPKNAILFQNRKVSFYYIDGFGLIELLEVTEGKS
jgi:methylmalonyl-CoA/ethylmalonyl-CoA epimerase